MTGPATGTTIITGGTGGLGRQTALRLSAAGRTVLLTGRDDRRTGDAARRISAETGHRVVAAPLDLASLTSVRRFAEDFPARGLPPLHAIVCNAGVQVVQGVARTEDGLETTFAVNHLAHLLLVELLLPHMAEPGAVVLVSSGTHNPAERTGMPAPRLTDAAAMADPAPDADGSAAEGRRRYTTSKLCNVLTAYELARRLKEEGRDIRVNAFDPGLMPGTGLARDYSPVQRLAWRYVLPALTVLPFLNIRTPRASGAALAALVTGPAHADVTGAYFRGRRPARSSEQSYDTAAARRLWEGSAELLGLPG
jgi:NAD(P)-dependent dehydrogenase (short-subunit alcohol dehydrogenase family)